MKPQVNAVSSAFFLTLRMLQKIFKWLPISTRKTVTPELIPSCLDYSNALYTSISSHLLKRLQIIQNTAARLILDLPRRTHI